MRNQSIGYASSLSQDNLCIIQDYDMQLNYIVANVYATVAVTKQIILPPQQPWFLTFISLSHNATTQKCEEQRYQTRPMSE